MGGGVDGQCVFNSVGFARECVKPLKLIVRDRPESAFVTVSKCGSKALIRAASSPHCSSPACQMKTEEARACANILGFFSNVLTNLRIWNTLGSSIDGLWVSAPTSALASSCWHLILTRQFSSSLIKCCCHSLKSLQKFVLPVRPVRAHRPWGGSLVYHQDEKCLFIFPPLTQKWMKCGVWMRGTNNSPCSLGLG